LKATIQRPTFVEGAESCACKLLAFVNILHFLTLLVSFITGLFNIFIADEERKKEANRLKQELYRFDLSKQIEEKRRLELEQKRKDQLEDEAIERMAREQEEKMKMEFEKENEKRMLAQLQVWNYLFK